MYIVLQLKVYLVYMFCEIKLILLLDSTPKSFRVFFFVYIFQQVYFEYILRTSVAYYRKAFYG